MMIQGLQIQLFLMEACIGRYTEDLYVNGDNTGRLYCINLRNISEFETTFRYNKIDVFEMQSLEEIWVNFLYLRSKWHQQIVMIILQEFFDQVFVDFC